MFLCVVGLDGKGVCSDDTERLLSIVLVEIEIVQGEKRPSFVLIEGVNLLEYMFLQPLVAPLALRYPNNRPFQKDTRAFGDSLSCDESFTFAWNVLQDVHRAVFHASVVQVLLLSLKI